VIDAGSASLLLASGAVVGFSLGLLGGGGSILAVPLLIYVVGVEPEHVAIGTSALAVALNALVNLLPHARAGNVRWASAVPFALVGAAAAFAGSTLGKAVEGRRLLALFGLLMIAVAATLARRRAPEPGRVEAPPPGVGIRLVAFAAAAGLLAGFFGIGGGFLIVPALIFATRMPILQAIGTSLVSVFAFGLTTAANYAREGLIAWPVAGLFLAGGTVGGWAGMRAAMRLGQHRRTLTWVFCGVVAAVGIYVFARNAGSLF
jgi:uncharacterized membrane protein YfcA